jgi:hypothetical protein
MHTPAAPPDQPTNSLTVAIANLVKQWKEVAASARELAAFGDAVANLAEDLHLSPAELRALATRGADAAKELPCLLDALRISIQALAEKEPLVLRDLQRVCTMCDQKRVCNRDIVAGTVSTNYEHYCANADTIRALQRNPTFASSE